MRQACDTWKDGAISAHKKLERLRAFLSFCVSSKWLDENPAKGVKPPKVTTPPTLPFSDEEMARILKACDQYPRKNSLGLDNRARIKAFVLLLRYSGLRLQDATSLEKVRLQEGALFLYTQKTGTPVYLPLPPHVVEAITTIRPASDERFFWSGLGLPRSAMSVWDRSLRRVLKLADRRPAQRAPIPGHVRDQPAFEGRPARNGLGAPGAPVHARYGASLFALGSGSAGCLGRRGAGDVEDRIGVKRAVIDANPANHQTICCARR